MRLAKTIHRCQGKLVVAVVLACSAVSAGEIDDLRQDRNQFPRTRWTQIYYLTLANIPAADRLRTQRAMDFFVASCSSQPILERSLPIRVTPTLFRLDTSDLRWFELPAILREHYPYSLSRGRKIPVRVRADWFIDFVSDQTQSDSYLRLLDGKNVPKNADDLFKSAKAEDSELTNNWVEDNSGVAVNKTRLLKAFPTTLRTDLWKTFDFKDLNPDTDPLQNLDRKLGNSFNEYIAPIVKVSLTTGHQGHLQRYALTNDKDVVAAAAPIDVVVDHTPLGPELITPRSCISCHVEGLRLPTINSLRRYVEAEIDGRRIAVIAPKNSKERERIERQFLAKLERDIRIHNLKYASIVKLITGGTTEQASADVVATIQAYNSAVDFEQAAGELGVTPQRLSATLATAGNIPARLAQLPKVPMSRENWEALYPVALRLVRQNRPVIVR